MNEEKHDKKACLAHDCVYFHEMLARMDEAIGDSYKMRDSYEAKIQDLAKETLRNSELRAELKAVLERETALKAALTDYGKHRIGCDIAQEWRDGKCTCGLARALSGEGRQ